MMDGNIRVGMRVCVYDKPEYAYEVVGTDNNRVQLKYIYPDWGDNEVLPQVVRHDIQKGAKVTFPKQDTLKLIKKYLYGESAK